MADADAAEPRTPDAERWEQAVAELSHRVLTAEGSLLALVVGANAALRQAFVADLGQRLVPKLEIRQIAFTPEHPNPLASVMEEAGVESRVFVLHGLSELSDEDRKNALHLLNWSRSQLVRRLVKVVLWVEPAMVRTLYQHAGDFADWWSVLVELPEVAPERRPAAAEPPGVWERFERLRALQSAREQLLLRGEHLSPELLTEEATLLDLLTLEARPGQILAGARLNMELEEGTWVGTDLLSGDLRLVHVFTAGVKKADFTHNFLTQTKLARSATSKSIAGIARVVATDDEHLAFATTFPEGNRLLTALTHDWDVRRVCAAFLRICNAALALEDARLCLRWLKGDEIVFDATGRPTILYLDGVADPASASLQDRDTVLNDPDWTGRRLTPKRDVYVLGRLLGEMLWGEDADPLRERRKTASMSSKDRNERALANIANQATMQREVAPFNGVMDLYAAILEILNNAGGDVSLESRINAALQRQDRTSFLFTFQMLGGLAVVVSLASLAGYQLGKTAAQSSALEIAAQQQELDRLRTENIQLREQIQALAESARMPREERAPPPEIPAPKDAP